MHYTREHLFVKICILYSRIEGTLVAKFYANRHSSVLVVD